MEALWSMYLARGKGLREKRPLKKRVRTTLPGKIVAASLRPKREQVACRGHAVPGNCRPLFVLDPTAPYQ